MCEPYREACYQQGASENDEHWDLAVTEASILDSPRKLHNLFCNDTEHMSTWQTPTALDEAS